MSRGFEIFLDVQRGLPRQGPGDDASTLKALGACAGLPAAPQVLDIGCGPGMQTLALAHALEGARIIAVDLLEEYIDELKRRIEAAGLAERVEARRGDMRALPFPPRAFDLIWSEGAAYSMGFDEALKAWRPLLKPGGYLAVSELVWLQDDPPEEAAAFFNEEYPPMKHLEANLESIKALGYEVVTHFVLPRSSWWTHYYQPLEAKLPKMREKYAGDEEALGVIAMSAREIEVSRRFSESYSYAFFVLR